MPCCAVGIVCHEDDAFFVCHLSPSALLRRQQPHVHRGWLDSSARGFRAFTEESSTKGAASLVLQTCGQPPRALSRAGFHIYVFLRAKKTRVSSVSTADGLV